MFIRLDLFLHTPLDFISFSPPFKTILVACDVAFHILGGKKNPTHASNELFRREQSIF